MKFRLLLFLLSLTFTLNLNAQHSIFMMSSIKNLSGSTSSVSAVNFKSNAACLDVQTGLAVLSGERNNGEFNINCEVKIKFNSLGIKLFPNPVNNITKVKFSNNPPLSEVFNLSIWTTEGTIITTKKESGYNLFQGLTLDLSALAPGSYFLKIESNSFVDAIKFIKAI